MGINTDVEVLQLHPSLRLVRSTVQNNPRWVLCDLEGFLDNANTPLFLDYGRNLLKNRTQLLGVRLTGITYISSTGVGALSSLVLESRQRMDSFVFLSEIPDSIQRVLNLLGFGGLFIEINNIQTYDFSKHLSALRQQ